MPSAVTPLTRVLRSALPTPRTPVAKTWIPARPDHALSVHPNCEPLIRVFCKDGQINFAGPPGYQILATTTVQDVAQRVAEWMRWNAWTRGRGAHRSGTAHGTVLVQGFGEGGGAPYIYGLDADMVGADTANPWLKTSPFFFNGLDAAAAWSGTLAVATRTALAGGFDGTVYCDPAELQFDVELEGVISYGSVRSNYTQRYSDRYGIWSVDAIRVWYTGADSEARVSKTGFPGGGTFVLWTNGSSQGGQDDAIEITIGGAGEVGVQAASITALAAIINAQTGWHATVLDDTYPPTHLYPTPSIDNPSPAPEAGSLCVGLSAAVTIKAHQYADGYHDGWLPTLLDSADPRKATEVIYLERVNGSLVGRTFNDWWSAIGSRLDYDPDGNFNSGQPAAFRAAMAQLAVKCMDYRLYAGVLAPFRAVFPGVRHMGNYNLVVAGAARWRYGIADALDGTVDGMSDSYSNDQLAIGCSSPHQYEPANTDDYPGATLKEKTLAWNAESFAVIRDANPTLPLSPWFFEPGVTLGYTTNAAHLAAQMRLLTDYRGEQALLWRITGDELGCRPNVDSDAVLEAVTEWVAYALRRNQSVGGARWRRMHRA